ncbi:MAG: hypothetical protein ACK4SZ_00500 [Allosphingosinicella sp.]|uniref:hypothetical protein n=1 Tax=Allosphingosinicella sp. TaxID=2823234 RepID=UPI00394E6E00
MKKSIEPIVIDGVTAGAMLVGSPAGVLELDRYAGRIAMSALAIPTALARVKESGIDPALASSAIHRLRFEVVPFDAAQASWAGEIARTSNDVDLELAVTWLIAADRKMPFATIMSDLPEPAFEIEVMRLNG